MATSYKVLGQLAPVADTPTDLYTCPAATQAIVSTLVICNRTTTQTFYRIAVRPAGAALATKHYIAYDSLADSSDTVLITIGITLNAGDVVTVQTNGNNSLSYSLFGSEIT